MKNLPKRYGEYALVTGASAGIGEEFARQLAAAGFQLVLVARRKDKLEDLAERLREQYATKIEVVALDLIEDGAVAELQRRTADLDIGLVVANAGIVTKGPFVENSISAELDLLKLNLSVPMEMAHSYGTKFAQRHKGALVLLGSTVGQQATPYLANYAAAKAYVTALGQALNYELKPSGVDVLVLSPGPTRTEGVETAEGIDFKKLPVPMMNPDRVVKKALNSLGKKSFVIPGGLNKFMDVMGKNFTPRSVQTRMFGRLLAGALDKNPRDKAD